MAIETAPRQDMKSDTREHFHLYMRAAIYHLVWHVQELSAVHDGGLDAVFRRFPFLSSYFRDVLDWLPPELEWDEGLEWWRHHIEHWEQECASRLLLHSFDEHYGFTYQHRLALIFAGLPDEDSRFGSVVSWLQAPLQSRRPSVELFGRVVGDRDAWRLCRPLIDSGLLQHDDSNDPRSEWVLRVPQLLWDILRGDEASLNGVAWRVVPRHTFSAPGELVFPEDVRRQVSGSVQLINDGDVEIVVVRGSEGSERLEILGAIAGELGRDIVSIQTVSGLATEPPPLLGPFAALTGSMPVFTLDPGPGETAPVPRLKGYHGPVGILLGVEGGLEDVGLARSMTITLPALGREERRAHWVRALLDHASNDLQDITDRYLLPGGHIRTVASMAVSRARMQGRQSVCMADIQSASRTLNHQQLDSLADFLEPDGQWDRLVTSETTTQKLRELEVRCRQREVLIGKLGRGFGTTTSTGVRALFTGPSGTGKTLAARTLAAELGMDLYRVDLAAVVNKYIGETEKNLHLVLSRAEQLDVVLLLDEGDALLGARTEVRTSNDRYANLETNYLLQRLEYFRGIIIVTTNAGQNIDPAFQRRMDIVVPFLAPRSEERRNIWDLHLPERHAISNDALDRIAQRCAFTGGQIRNAAMLATLLAVDQSAGLLQECHLVEAIQSEYRKSGASLRLHQGNILPGPANSLAHFVNGARPGNGGHDVALPG